MPPTVVELARDLGLDRLVVPLGFAMRPLLWFDLRLDGLPVPLVTRRGNVMATRGLLQAAVEPLGVEADARLQYLMARVADADDPVADATLEHLHLADQDPEADSVEEELLRWAIKTFDRNYLLLAEVPLRLVRDRIILKITQDMTVPPASGRGITWEQLRSRIAWHPISLVYDAPDVMTSASYHFQFVPSEGLAINDGALVAFPDDPEQEPVVFGHKASRYSVLGLNTHAKDVPPASSYSALVQVRPSPDGLLRASSASAWLSTVLLLMASVVAPHVDIQSQAGPFSALLLVLPGAVSTFLARPGEHPLVAHTLRGVRVLTLISAMTTYFAAALLVVGLSNSALRIGWLALAAMSALPAALLAVAVRRCRLGMQREVF